MNVTCKFNNFNEEDEKDRFRLQEFVRNFSKFFPDHIKLHAVYTKKRNGKIQLSVLTHAFDTPILVSATAPKVEQVVNQCFVKLFRAYNSSLIRFGQKQMLPIKNHRGQFERAYDRDYYEESAGL